MTAHSLIKDYGLLEYWRRITHSMGEQPSIAFIQNIIRYRHKKQLVTEQITTPTPATPPHITPTTPTTIVTHTSYMSTPSPNRF